MVARPGSRELEPGDSVRAETIDRHGTVHRPNCPALGYDSNPSISGWTITRCKDCGASRLNRTTTKDN